MAGPISGTSINSVGDTSATQGSSGELTAEQLKEVQTNAGFVLFGNIMGMQREVKKTLDEGRELGQVIIEIAPAVA